MKRIIVPTDFSACAENAVNYAVHLAEKANAELILMHVCELLEPNFSRYKALIYEHNEGTKRVLFEKLYEQKRKIEHISSKNIGVKLYECENLTAGILHGAHHNSADLIVMGTQGVMGISRKLFGTKAAHIINQSNIPVLTIPPDYNWSEPNRIVLAIDDSYEEIEILKPVFELASLWNAPVTALIFTEEDTPAINLITRNQNVQSIEQKLKHKFRKASIDVVHLLGSEFHTSIQQYIIKNKISLLSMITHKRGFIHNIFDSSLTQKMSYQSRVPLLSLHAVEELAK